MGSSITNFNFINDVLGKKSYDKETRTTRNNRAPETYTRTDHALSIRVRGQTIGHMQQWSPQQSRAVSPVYEINSASPGAVSENVPGSMGGLTITVGRIDLYADKMETVWGPSFDIVMLMDQSNPITINERWDNPDGTTEVFAYVGCWFTSLGRQHSAQGDRITRANATFSYVRKYRVAEIKSYAEDLTSKWFG